MSDVIDVRFGMRPEQMHYLYKAVVRIKRHHLITLCMAPGYQGDFGVGLHAIEHSLKGLLSLQMLTTCIALIQLPGQLREGYLVWCGNKQRTALLP